MSKKLSKYIVVFDYIDKTLIVLCETFRGISIISFTSVIGFSAGKASASFTLVFSVTTEIIKKLLKATRNKKKKDDKIVMLAKSKCILHSIETLVFQTLIDLNISHEEFKTIVNEKENYEHMKGSIRNIKNRDELSENSGNIRENRENAWTKKTFFLFCVYKDDLYQCAEQHRCKSSHNNSRK